MDFVRNAVSQQLALAKWVAVACAVCAALAAVYWVWLRGRRPRRREGFADPLAPAPATAPPLAANAAAPTAGAAAGGEPEAGVDYRDTNAGLRPVKFALAGRTHWYQLPAGAVAGTLAVFPGCARGAAGFWPYHPTTAKEFTGFPEDVSRTKQALARGYAVLVLEPKDTRSLCWSGRVDLDPALEAIDAFLSAHGLHGKPLYVLGASSGGAVSLSMPLHVVYRKSRVRVSGVIQEVSTNAAPRVDPKTGKLNPPNFPPVAWVVMSEPGEKANADKHAALLRRNRVPAGVAVSGPHKITPHYFSDRIPAITPAQSRQIAAGLLQIGQIDNKGTLLSDPKKSGWDRKLKAVLPALMAAGSKTLTLAFRKSPVWQAMLVAYSKHEHTAEYTTAALMWLESGGKGSFEDLAAKHRVAVPAALKIS